MKKSIEGILRKLFDIRPGEYRKAILMQLNIFLIISTLLIVKPAVNGLFLAKLGVENLPNAFVLVAVFAGLVSFIYSRLLSRIALNSIITRTMMWSVISLIIFGLLLRFNVLEGWVLYIFYIWVAIFAVLSASQFWILANIVFNPREAKRLFGFIGAGAIAGGIFGGYLTSLIADWITSENLLFVAAFLLVFCIPITQTIWKKEVLKSQTQFQRKKRFKGFEGNPIALIKKSKHLTYLATIIGIGVIVAKLVDYQFSAIASANISNPDELTAFFGFWFSSFNVISLLIQLFFTRKLVGVFGVGTSLFILPFGIVLGAFLVLIFPELWAVIILKLVDGSLKQSVNKSATELMVLPIPLEIKNQTKSFIDVFVDSAATGISGLILIFLVTGFDLSTRLISIMIIALFFVWIYFSRKIRQEYIHSFKIKIEQNKEKGEAKDPFDFSKESVLNGLRNVLQKGNEMQVLFILRKIKEVPDERLFEDVIKLLEHPSSLIRAEVLQCIYFFRNRRVVEKVLPLIKDPDQQVKTAAFEYLIEHAPENQVDLFTKYLQDKDYRVRGAALVSLATETRDNAELRSKFSLEDKVKKKVSSLAGLKDPEEIKFRKIVILKAIALSNIPEHYPVIKQYMKDDDPDIVKQAISSAGNTMSQDFIDPIATFLNIEAYRPLAKTAFLNYGPGIIESFNEIVRKDIWGMELLHHIPSIAGQFGVQQSVEFLFFLLDHSDIGLRMESLKALNALKISHPNLRFHNKDVIKRVLEEAHLYLETLTALYSQTSVTSELVKEIEREKQNKILDARKSLISLLEKRLDGNLERIFRLLGLKYPFEDILNIYQGIQSKKPDMRVNAIEFLDNLLETNLKKILVPIVETALLDAISEDALKNLNLKIPDEFQCLTMLLSGKDTRINLAVFYLITQLKDKKYIPLVTGFTQSDNPKIKTFAKQALNEILLD
ncbi:MAG: HEAT repeat domain-containing protein [Bacteroidales bacterium]|nr:HEAT repeat domain-containing protein [Bacteroidales bacterium]MCF8402640.1 HEAT repeat domain-containing protein [Bacteroidales bacterium]